MEARLEVRTVEERLRAVAGRADALRRGRAAERRPPAGEGPGQTPGPAGGDGPRGRRGRPGRAGRASSGPAPGRRRAAAAEQASHGRDTELKTVRARIRELTAELDTAVNSAHGAEMERAARRMRLEQAAERAAEEFAIDPDTLLAEYGPEAADPGRR